MVPWCNYRTCPCYRSVTETCVASASFFCGSVIVAGVALQCPKICACAYVAQMLDAHTVDTQNLNSTSECLVAFQFAEMGVQDALVSEGTLRQVCKLLHACGAVVRVLCVL